LRASQLRTVKELMNGKTIKRPSNVAAVYETLEKAPKAKGRGGHQHELGGENDVESTEFQSKTRFVIRQFQELHATVRWDERMDLRSATSRRSDGVRFAEE